MNGAVSARAGPIAALTPPPPQSLRPGGGAWPPLLGLPLIGLAALALQACQPSHPSGRLIVATRSGSSFDSVDPLDITSFAGAQLLSAVGDPLYVSDAQGRIQPRLATALPRLSADGRTATIPLRRDVRFHDGSRFDAAAMLFSLERYRAKGKFSYLLAGRIEAMATRGPDELVLRLKRPYSALPALLSSVNLIPLSPTAYREHARSALRQRLVSTGPYRLTSFNPQQQTLEPFAGYWGAPPANRGLHLVSLSNSTALYGALVSGEIDVLLSDGLETDQLRSLQRRAARGEFVEGTGPSVEIGYLTLLADRPPLDNALLRRAVALSLDRRLISERVSFGLRDPLRTLVPAPLPGSATPLYPGYDPPAARALFRQAGYCNGRRLALPLTFRSNVPADRLFALTWQAQLRRDLGDCVTLEISGVESTTAYNQLDKGVFPMILLEWRPDYPDPDNYLVPLLGCDKSQGTVCLEGNSALSGSFWTAPGLEQQLQATETATGPARTRLFEAIQRQAAAGASFLPLWRVPPRAWAQPGLETPRFDGSGRVLLQALRRSAP